MKTLNLAVALLLFSGLAVAAPCSLGVSIQPDSPVFGQPISISYSAPYLGFIQEPSLAIDGNTIAIGQPTVHADPAGPGSVPCGQRTVQVGVLPPGYYSVTVNLSSSTPMSGSFIVAPGTVSVCGMGNASATGPGTGTLSVSVRTDNGSVLAHFQNQGFAEYVGGGPFRAPFVGTPIVHIADRQISVIQAYLLDSPVENGGMGMGMGQYARFCQVEDIDLGALAPGTYTLAWTYVTPSGPVSVTSSFTNGSTRNRSVRMH